MKTVRVRIAVAVNKHGGWCASGSESLSDEDAMGLATAWFDDDGITARYWVTADLPVPVEPEIAGEVEKVGG